jgi:hypothetical protein
MKRIFYVQNEDWLDTSMEKDQAIKNCKQLQIFDTEEFLCYMHDKLVNGRQLTGLARVIDTSEDEIEMIRKRIKGTNYTGLNSDITFKKELVQEENTTQQVENELNHSDFEQLMSELNNATEQTLTEDRPESQEEQLG